MALLAGFRSAEMAALETAAFKGVGQVAVNHAHWCTPRTRAPDRPLRSRWFGMR